jgi:sulfofructose kinase
MEMTTCPPPDVVGLGSCAWDLIGVVEHIPDFDAPTQSLADLAASGGGPVSTALVALARLGARTGYLGVVGDDEFGLNIKRAFVGEGVDVSHLRVQDKARSAVCFVLVHAQTGRRSIVCYRGTYKDVELQQADYRYITSAPFLHLDGHHMNAAITAARWMRKAGGTVVLDANRLRPRLDELLPWVDVLITNASFPHAYTGQKNLEDAARELARTGARLVVTTLGEKGCQCFSCEECLHVPGFVVKAVDTTGAGDAFHGAFIYGLLHGWSLLRTATFANAVAALNCTALGGRAGLPRLGKVQALLQGTGRWAE